MDLYIRLSRFDVKFHLIFNLNLNKILGQLDTWFSPGLIIYWANINFFLKKKKNYKGLILFI
jgi:hypothetical protein